jgi:glycosyltransferase involved in cell wall biosynthesis
VRIALIAPPWLPVPPPAYGGTETVVDILACGLAARGHDVLLCATGDSTSASLSAWAYATAQTPRIGSMAVEVTHVLHAYDHVVGADVIHDHTITGPVRAAAQGNLPVVTTNHGPFDRELGAIYRDVARHVAVIAISAHQAAGAGDTPIEQVIHHGVDAARFPVGPGGGYVAFLGRMTPSKGPDLAARAARAAGVPLLMAAKMREPAEREYFDAEVRPLLGGDVEYVGELSATDKLDLLAGAAALLNPLRWHEPFGLVMIEALACGTPVIAPGRGSVPEIVDHGTTGFVYDDDAELVRALGRIDTLDRGACRLAAETRFSADRMVGEHLDVYERVLWRHARRTTRAATFARSDGTAPVGTRSAGTGRRLKRDVHPAPARRGGRPPTGPARGDSPTTPAVDLPSAVTPIADVDTKPA